MHKHILTKEQIKLLPILRSFSKDFFLVDGTAIALYVGHRQSIDFDLFSISSFSNLRIRAKLARQAKIERVFVNAVEILP